MKYERLLSPWVFVLTGILFNILSAVITHYFIGLNNDEINAIDREIGNREVLIDGQWQAKIEVERKQEFFILLLADGPRETEVTKQFFHGFIHGLVNAHALRQYDKAVEAMDGVDLDLMLAVSAAAQASIIDTINDAYFETLELREARMPLERANARLFSIAIFLQVTGLILVLARDLKRR